MVKSAKSALEEEVYDDRELHATNYGSSHNDGSGGTGQQPATPRSKHSATEQRRRSKINERFQILRDLIPQNDQKRDKASFLLEVIEYIQYLKEKLHVYEGSLQTWGQENPKLMTWRNHNEPLESYVDCTQVITNGSAQENNVVSPIITNAHNLVESDLSVDAAYRVLDHSHEPNVTLQSNLFSPGGKGCLPVHLSQGSMLDAEHLVAQAQCQVDQGEPCATECAIRRNPLQEQEFTTESKAVSISSAYSQGVLHTLTQALQSSGVDMSQASVSVQIDVGKQTRAVQNATPYDTQDDESLHPSIRSMPHPFAGSRVEDPDQAFKRIRRENS